MGLLKNNTEALEKLLTYSKERLEELFGRQEAVSGRVVGALYNSDTERKKSILYQLNPSGIVAGLKAMCVLTGAVQAVIVVESASDMEEIIMAAKRVGLPLEIEQENMVDVIAHRNDRLCSLDELTSMAEVLCGRTPGILVAVDEGLMTEWERDATLKTVLHDIYQEDSAIKGVLYDHKFCSLHNIENRSLASLQSKSGVIRVIRDSQCTINLACAEIEGLRKKSCGKCTFCREGLFQLEKVMCAISNGQAKDHQVPLAAEIGEAMCISCNCSLGNEAGMPVITLLQEFGGEVERHINKKECHAGVCLALLHYYIDPKQCKGCGACISACPVQCIAGKVGYTSVIDEFDCTRCGKCLEGCTSQAVKKVSGRLPIIPDKPMRIKGVEMSEETIAENQVLKTAGGRKRRRVYAKTE